MVSDDQPAEAGAMIEVLKNPADAADVHFDYVVCAAKAIDQDAIAEDLSPVISENTTIVIIQNGLGNEDAFRAAYPECTILSGVVRSCSLVLLFYPFRFQLRQEIDDE